MDIIQLIKRSVFVIVLLSALYSCNNRHKKKLPSNFNYKVFKDSIKEAGYDNASDNSNIFDSTIYTPGVDSFDTLLLKIDESWKADVAIMLQLDTLLNVWKKYGKYTAEDSAAILENIKVLDSFFLKKQAIVQTDCKEKDCLLYAEIIKSNQTMYLYLDAELIDSFPVSSGIPKYETPEMSVRPAGPLLKKYTSKKFPGGNFNGLGNMPYAVFVRGGYAIHGTTAGNFSKLGTRASHGCIRLHPVNAKIFYELVKRIGLENTWVTIKDSLYVP